MADGQHRLVSYKEAIALGLKTYFTGRPCKRGHIALRGTSDCKCRECNRLEILTRRSEDREAARRVDREWKNNNRARIRSNERARYAKNPEKHKSKTRRQYWDNADLKRSKHRLYHYEIYKNPDVRKKAAERTREWTKKNPEKAKVNHRNGKAKRKNIPGKHTAADIKEIARLQGYCCALCRQKLTGKHHVDHIIAVSRGGTNERRNLQLLCEPCNLAKGARDPIMHAQSLGFLL